MLGEWVNGSCINRSFSNSDCLSKELHCRVLSKAVSRAARRIWVNK